MEDTTLFLRVDASPVTGAGHAMRLAALAGAWQAAGLGGVRCAGSMTIPFVRERFDLLGIMPEPGATPVPSGAVLVVDSYDDQIRKAGGLAADAALRLLVDDGAGPVPFGYDLVWWPAPFGERDQYRHFTGTVITGPQAVPLHAGLPLWHPDGTARTAISLGGGTIPEPLKQAMRRLEQQAWWTAFSATGDWVPESWHRIPPGRFWAGASQCDRLIVAGGVSALEAAAVGIPCVVVAFVANQIATLAWARAAGVPTIDAIEPRDSDELAGALDQALRAARPLPALTDGAPHVAAQLAALAHRVPA